MKTMRVIWKSYNLYTSSITIIKVEKPDETTKIYLYSNVTDLNEATIKDAGLISH